MTQRLPPLQGLNLQSWWSLAFAVDPEIRQLFAGTFVGRAVVDLQTFDIAT